MCGLTGYIGVEKTLDKKTLLTLGCINDSRGGDSTGLFIDKQVEYGIEKEKLFSDFYPTSNLLEKTTTAKIALVHCRKASIGGIGLSTAQPVVINNHKTDEVEFVLLHNGTLTNHKALAKTYLKDVPDTFTDSQIIAYIIYHHGFGVLAEYEGAGTFVIVDYRNDKENPDAYMFKGESLQYSYSKEVSEERPLFISVEKDGIWFSSICEFLETTRYDDGTVYSLKGNLLYHIKNGKIKSTIKYDRSKRHQSVSNFYGANYANYDNYSEYDDRALPAHPVGHVNSTMMSSTFVCNNYCLPKYSANEKLLFIDGVFVINNKNAQGKYALNPYGFGNSSYVEDNEDFWFFDGILLYNEKCYNVVNSLFKLFEIEKPEDFVDGFPEIVYPYSPLLYYDILTKKYVKYKGLMSANFTGKLGIILDSDDTEYNFMDGRMITKTTYKYSPVKRQMEIFNGAAKAFDKLDVETEVEDICNWLGYTGQEINKDKN